jgi:hypothetical protein
MTATIDPQYAASSRLKQVNLELGRLAREHHACRVNSFGFSALGSVVLAISVVGLIHLGSLGVNDWTRNPESPVYAIAAEQEDASMFEAVLVAAGFVTGLGLLYRVRRQCSKQHRLWKEEGDLRREMRQLRDKLYVADQLHSIHQQHPKRHLGQAEPLDPDEARGEYVGIYNPPASHRDHGPERF